MSEDFLYRQLIKLGDMMGDGMHLEADGKWIEREYASVVKALGLKRKYGKRQKKDTSAIDKAMAKRVIDFKCLKCTGKVKQTRKGSLRAECIECKTKFQLLKRSKRKQ